MIAVTGAAGFIGSNLAHRLASLGHDLLLVDHPLTAAKAANWVGLRCFQFRQHDDFLDLLERDQAPRLDGVFHLGACSRTTETDEAYLRRNNVKYTEAVWRWCAGHGCPLVYASSAATYGDGSRGFDDRLEPTALRPLNAYGRSKNDFDQWALAQVEAGEPTPPRWAGLKFFNVYGPRKAHKGGMASVVWHAWRQVRESGEVRLFRSTHPDYPDGGQRRDFVYVEDCVNHILWHWQNAGAWSGDRAPTGTSLGQGLPTASPPGLYNSGTGGARTFRELAEAVFAALKRPPRIRYIDMPPTLAAQYQNFTQADMSKLRGAGYTAAPTALEEGVRRCVAAYETL